MEDKLFQAPGTAGPMRTLVDGGIKINIDVQEMQSEDMARLFQYDRKNVWFLLKGGKITKDEILKIPKVVLETGQKSPSQRLRDRMFVYYKRFHPKTEGFDNWYNMTLDKIGQSYLEKLD